MSRIKKRETKVDRSCASKRMKMNARATSWVTHGDETTFLQRQHGLEPLTHIMNCACAGTTARIQLCSSRHTMNWNDKHVLLKWKDRHSLLTWNRTRELETAFVLCVLVHAGNLKFRFQHGPFTKRFGPVVTRVPARCAFHISILPTRSHTCLDAHVLFTPPRRLQWIVIDCKRNLQQRQKDTVQKILSVHIFQIPRTLKSGVHQFAALENSFNRRDGVFQCRSSIFCLGNGIPRACPSVFAWHSLIDSASKKIRAYRQSFSAWRWAAEVDSAFALGLKIWLRVSPGCQMHLD